MKLAPFSWEAGEGGLVSWRSEREMCSGSSTSMVLWEDMGEADLLVQDPCLLSKCWL